MRQELTKYNYDWSLWSIFHLAYRATQGFDAELQQLLRLIPNFQNPFQVLLRIGEPGKLVLKMVDQYLADVLNAHQEGKKIALNTFCFPSAILDAFEVINVCAEPLSVLGTVIYQRGVSEFVDHCVEAGYSDTACAAQRGAMGAFLHGCTVRPDFVLCNTPGVCDTNANAYSFMASYLDLPFYQLNYPPELTSQRAREYHRQDFRNLIDFLEQQTGRKLCETNLRNIMAQCMRQDELVNDILELERLVPSPVPAIAGFFIYAGRFMALGKPIYTELLESLLALSQKNLNQGKAGTPSGSERIRLLYLYLDHYNPNLAYWKWMDDNDVTNVGNVLDLFWNQGTPYSQGKQDQTYQLVLKDLDSMIDSLADQASRMPMAKQIRGSYDAPQMWLDDICSLAQIFSPDCLIYAGSAGCRNTWGMVKLAAIDLEKMGYPTLILHSDGFEPRVESWDLTANRIEEFLKVRGLVK